MVERARLQPPRAQPAPRPPVAIVERARRASCRTTSAALLALPGIGPYTARAVLAFAFERRPRHRGHEHRSGPGPVGRRAARAEGGPAGGRRAGARRRRRGPGTRRCSTSARPSACGARRAATTAPSPPHCAWWAAGRPEPDPAEGTAGVSTGQSAFAGSDRQGRGRLVDGAPRRRGARRPTWPRPWGGPTTGRGRSGWPRTLVRGRPRPRRRARPTAWRERRQPVRWSTMSRLTSAGLLDVEEVPGTRRRSRGASRAR